MTEDKLETATFGIGCFWSEAVFGKLDGVKKTRVGYAGGSKEDPTYQNLGDHTEVVQVDFDPEEISYERLLDEFWDSHSQIAKKKTQYRSVILYHTEEQRKKAEESLEKMEEKVGPVETEVEPMKEFYVAEDYHQKYHLRGSERFEEFEDLSDEELRESAEAAKANTEVAGHC
jgi:peptide-methionine (S)-S-oxide reductase